jgi:predicted SAM-dependent methyltransferase
VTDQMYLITEAKNKDYSGEWAVDAFANFKVVEHFWLTTEQWFLARLCDKFKRISNLTKQEAAVKDESITDTLLDMANYAILFKIYLESRDRLED